MHTDTAATSAETDIRELLHRWCQAAQAKDLDGITAHYAPGIVAYDAVMQLQFRGLDSYRAHWKNCLEMSAGPMIFEPGDIRISANGDTAFAYFLCLCGCTDADGSVKSGWTRATICLRRLDNRWMVVHEHFSVPFDMPEGKALFDLQP